MIPVAASTIAPEVDRIYLWLVILGGGVMALVGTLILVFAIRYRRGSSARRGPLPEWLSREVELGWTVATAFVFLFIFWWAFSAELIQFIVPANAMEVHVVARQWMWKTQSPAGVREINALHVPLGRPVRLVMISQDVIHSFYVPAFRIKQDVLPGRYTSAWFTATRVGDYHLFCAEYCGTDHAAMLGTVSVMQPEDYAAWVGAQPQPDDLAARGATLYRALGCSGCHEPGSRVRAPALNGIYGTRQPLADGSFAPVDEAYLRDAMMLPQHRRVAGYDPVMPSYQGTLDEEQIIDLIAYLQAKQVGRSMGR